MGICERCGATAPGTTCPLCGSTRIVPSTLPPVAAPPPVTVTIPARVPPPPVIPDAAATARPQDQSPGRGARTKRALVIGGLAAAGLLVGVFALNGLGTGDRGQGPAEANAAGVAASTPRAVAPPSDAAPETVPSPDPPDISPPVLSGCWAVDSDAAELATYATHLGPSASTPAAASEFTAAFAQLESSCGVVYASDVAVALARQPGLPSAVQGAADSYAASQVRFPAPAGSLVRQKIDSPEKNISCELEESSVGCSILERRYPVSEDCPERLFSAVLVNGDAEKACGTQWLGEVGDDFYHIDYGETVQFGFMACTVEADGPRRGMTCWDTRTGHSLRLSRALFEIDNTL